MKLTSHLNYVKGIQNLTLKQTVFAANNICLCVFKVLKRLQNYTWPLLPTTTLSLYFKIPRKTKTQENKEKNLKPSHH